ncbi:DUF6221 family protein [Pseudonocardia hispaniensis]|uniref:DUF6221 family protein n=1 Tax=Pseudonocardia hispaniensis TaxID=904933 RepID=A0ABW1IWU8_9PSEU
MGKATPIRTEPLVEFLQARLDEDERIARAAGGDALELTDVDDPDRILVGRGRAVGEHVVRHNPERVLVEVTAKRQILELYHRACDPNHGEPSAEKALRQAVEALAQPYRAHPHFHPAWLMED